MGFDVLFPDTLEAGGVSIKPIALVKNFGAQNGMIILQEFDEMGDAQEEFAEKDYGFSAVEIGEDDDLTEMLNDWEFSGNPKAKPDWAD